MIKQIRIRNFKSLQDVTVQLGPFTVLVGQNGAGKSSFLQAIQMLSWLVRNRSINDVLHANGLSYNELVYLKASNSTMRWDVQVEVPLEAGRSSLDAIVEIGLAKRKHVYVSHELVRRSGEPNPDGTDSFVIVRRQKTMGALDGTSRLSYENVTLPHSLLLDAAQRPDEFPRLGAIAKQLAGFMHYEIWGPELLRQPSEGPADTLAGHGENLAAVLFGLRRSRPGQFSSLVKELQDAYGWLDSIEFRRLGESRYALSFLERTTDKRKKRIRYEPSQVSDGFLRLLALTTLKYQTGVVTILGYEEPENGMHPGMLIESVRRLRDIARAGTQVIVTTHSPFLLQHLLTDEGAGRIEDELRLVWRGDDGRTVIDKPSTQLLDKARAQGIGIGELWAMLLEEKDMASTDRAPGE